MPRYAVDPAGQRDLDDEADERGVGADLRQERGDGADVGGAFLRGCRHVELLLDDGRADRRKADDHGDGLQMAGRPQQANRLRAAHPAFLTCLAGVTLAGSRLLADNRRHDRRAHRKSDRADQEHGVRADPLDKRRSHRRAGETAQAGARADEPEDPLRLARVVDVVGQRPELTDEQNADDRAVQVKGHGDHAAGGVLAEQPPERAHRHHDARERDRNHPAARRQRDGPGVALHDEADDDARPELDPRQVLGAQLLDEQAAGDRLDHVVPGHRQERVEEHQQNGGAFTIPELDDRADQAGEHAGILP